MKQNNIFSLFCDNSFFQEYLARRAKNNESAKRSREARRHKEAEKDQKIAELQAYIHFLQQENIRLRNEINQINRPFQGVPMANPITPKPFNVNIAYQGYE